MVSDNLAKQLRDLRLRAGNPSYRDIERLLKGTGRNREMARSTIQEKLTGKNPLKLHQTLALVAAIAEYAQSNGTPLSPQEVDEKSWRAKFVATSRPSSYNSNKESRVPHTTGNPPEPWDASPLRNAGMSDLLDLISQSEGAPLSTWVPHVAAEMFTAQMSCESLMKWTAQASPHEIVQCTVALEGMFPLPDPENNDSWGNWSPGNNATVEKLLRHTARQRSLQNVPVLVVGLRRASVGQYVDMLLTSLAQWHLSHALQAIVARLRAAALSQDALKMLGFVGSHRQPTRILEVVSHFSNLGAMEERDSILKGMASDVSRFIIGAKESDPELQDVLMSSIPWNKKPDYAKALTRAGLHELASRIEVPLGGYSDEPPF
ncbi:hypothetical protein [Streptomyces roseolilacinus]|uniref:Uncharacterized protein n=1 Tax=Streptomyces roseolilacinus TaxID=66904 RepID=A0A918B1R9_9ACTN|nr:hypothetical protein [Streptomyces roseolilacinus]GGQ12625.1 hypothetical protein GCM10010249_34080 [Streptomyces roseolilacinus]